MEALIEVMICLLGTGLLGSYLWWVYMCLYVDDIMLSNPNPYMNLDFKTWATANGGVSIVGPLVIILYLCCRYGVAR